MSSRRGFLKVILAVAAAPVAVVKVLANPMIPVRRIIGPFRDEKGRDYFIHVQPLPRVHSEVFFLDWKSPVRKRYANMRIDPSLYGRGMIKV